MRRAMTLGNYFSARFLWSCGFVPILILFASACTTSETATPTEKVVEKEATSGPTPTPIVIVQVATPTPAATVSPKDLALSTGKVTVMVASLGSERFDETFTAGQTAILSYMRLLHGFLVSSNENLALTPGIATKWSVSPDGTTWTFNIRKGVKFHNGTELTPEDVRWTIDHIIGPGAETYSFSADATATFSKYIDEIKVTDPDEVRVTGKRPLLGLVIGYWGEPATHSYGIMPARAKQHDEAEEAAYDKRPIGAGPMKLVDLIPAFRMRWERFDDFYFQPKYGLAEDRRVPFKSLDLVLAPEEATRIAAIRAGEADIAPVSLAAKKQVEAEGGRLVFGREGVYFSMVWVACYDPQAPCSDQGVRVALDYAIDKEALRDQLYGREVMAVKGTNLVTPSTIGYTPAVDPRPFDPEKGRQLLAEAGYPGGKGFGKLTITTYPSSALPLMPETAQVIADVWRKELGLDVEVNVSDSVTTRNAWREGKLNNTLYLRENETRLDGIGSLAKDYSSDAVYRARDPELRDLLLKGSSIIDPDEQAEFAKKAFLLWKERTYEIGIGYVNIPWAVGPRISIWNPRPLAAYPSALHTIVLK